MSNRRAFDRAQLIIELAVAGRCYARASCVNQGVRSGRFLPWHKAVPRYIAAIRCLGPQPFDVLVVGAMNVNYSRTQIRMARRWSRDDSTCIGRLDGHSAAPNCLSVHHYMRALREINDCKTFAKSGGNTVSDDRSSSSIVHHLNSFIATRSASVSKCSLRPSAS
jgi:hypothetical protein